MLQVNGLSVKLFGELIVKKLNFTLERGDKLGIIGPNGCGKSTLLKALVGTLPYSGCVNLKNSYHKKKYSTNYLSFGFVPEEPVLFPKLSVDRNLKLTTILNKNSVEQKESLLHLLQLTKFRKRKAGSLSQGEKKRLAIAMALVKDPAVLILDEPNNGLDVVSLDIMNRLLSDTLSGKIIITASHYLEHVENNYHKVLILKNGQVKAFDKIENINSRYFSLEKAYNSIVYD